MLLLLFAAAVTSTTTTTVSGKYAAEHTSAVADIAAAGNAVTFTRASAGTYDGVADSFTTATTSTIAGQAMQVHGDAQRYDSLGLVLATMPTLFFAPTSYPLAANATAFVEPGDTVVWSGVTYTARDVDPLAPDGYVITARVIVSG